VKLVTYSVTRRAPVRIGVIAPDGHVIDLEVAARKSRVKLPFDPVDMTGLITAGRAGLALVRKVVAGIKSGHHALNRVTLHAPLPRPRKNIFCVGWNYLEHFEEGAKARPHVQEMPTHPAFFTKAPTTVNTPYGPVPLHAETTQRLDWEAELGVIIGRGGRNIAEAAAMKHVFGYTVINDVTGRDVQRQHGQQWFKGKSLDGTCPMGPWIVTTDEVRKPDGLRITCRINGVTKQDSNTGNMYFKIPRIIAELSAGLTLEPCDIISTGTPAGVGHARNPPEFMKQGDVMETEVEGIGLLRNIIAG